MFDHAPLAPRRQTIAVIGSGVAGLGAAWALSARHRVTLYEAADYLGGHSNTVDVTVDDATFPVDTGFIVYNERNYPNLTRLFAHLGVATEASDMSFAFSIGGGRLEYAGAARLQGLFAQRRNIVNPEFWAMVRDILRFNREMRGAGADGALETLTLGELLCQRGYSRAFTDRHLLPMAAAIWSGSMRSMLDFPAASFVRFFDNHGLLSVGGRPQWRTVSGGSRSYVRRLGREIHEVLVNRPVTGIRRDAGGVHVTDAHGQARRFDQVVLAAHADQALGMLDDASADERRVLGSFTYQPNRAVLHRDPDLMPRRRRAWASWNYLAEPGTDMNRPSSVTYWMNRLQNLPAGRDVFVTLNPIREPRPDLVERTFVYDHPQYDAATIRAQRDLPAIQGQRRTWYCGSYFGYGFHEDALTSGLSVAALLGAPAPWLAGAGLEPVLEAAA